MPSVLKDCRAAKPTKPMPRYIADGSGRDVIIAFSREPNPPNFNHYSENRPHHLPTKEKRGNAKVPAISRFVPDGSGRDLFQQQNNDYVFPVHNQIRGEAISPKRRHISNACRARAPPRFKPSGSGRDMSYSNIDVYQTTTSQNSFRTLKPSASNGQMLRPRTSPPPRFVSSGKESFHLLFVHMHALFICYSVCPPVLSHNVTVTHMPGCSLPFLPSASSRLRQRHLPEPQCAQTSLLVQPAERRLQLRQPIHLAKCALQIWKWEWQSI
jgi:hypothetical protein